MGDILDPLHSTRWLDSMPGDANYTRPWTDPNQPAFANKVQDVTHAILEENRESVGVLRDCAEGKAIRLAPGDSSGKPDFGSRERLPIKVRIHYMVGNHDWYYHLKGEAFDRIRTEIIEQMGLSNPATNFPFEAEEYPPLLEIMERYKIYGRHGDAFDKFNFDRKRGRDASTLGDAFTMDVCNRFPVEALKRYGDYLPSGIVQSLRLITNIRPALATPLWISGQIRKNAGTPSMEKDLKRVWDQIAEEFLQLDFLRKADKAYRFDVVDAMQMVVKISGKASFGTINDVVTWVHNMMSEGLHSFAPHALKEPAFLQDRARYVVYGHTHHYEVVPLDISGGVLSESEMYFNSGTWRSYFDLAIRNPREQKFVPYQTLSYVAFFTGGERGGQNFEAWSGTYA